MSQPNPTNTGFPAHAGVPDAVAASNTHGNTPTDEATPLAAAPSREREGHARNGWTMLPVVLLLWLVDIALMVVGILMCVSGGTAEDDNKALIASGVTLVIVSAIGIIAMIFLSAGFFTLQPNEARVLVLFGEYRGTIRTTGFYWANPFYSSTLSQGDTNDSDDDDSKSAKTPARKAVNAKVSLRARTLNGPRLKVNDKNGNPIEIAAVIVWHIVDTAKAVFDVDQYEQYVSTQSETALRHVASLYAYDHNDEGADESERITLRANILEVSETLKNELVERLKPAGITVEDARLTHLAYAPEIAQVMLRRQQAEAIIAARTKIVQGAVTMVDMALKELEHDDVVSLDEERKATMVSNLMVVLCGDSDAQPVINAGSLYN